MIDLDALLSGIQEAFQKEPSVENDKFKLIPNKDLAKRIKFLEDTIVNSVVNTVRAHRKSMSTLALLNAVATATYYLHRTMEITLRLAEATEGEAQAFFDEAHKTDDSKGAPSPLS